MINTLIIGFFRVFEKIRFRESEHHYKLNKAVYLDATPTRIMQMNELQHYNLGYTEVFVFENYLINQIKEGETVVVDHAEVLKKMIDIHYPDRKMVYLSNRVNSYAVDPMVYLKVAEIENLTALGIITNSPIKQKTALYEKNFSAKPYEIFTSMSDAVIWATKLIQEY